MGIRQSLFSFIYIFVYVKSRETQHVFNDANSYLQQLIHLNEHTVLDGTRFHRGLELCGCKYNMRRRNMKYFHLTWNNTDLGALKALAKYAGSDALCQLKM